MNILRSRNNFETPESGKNRWTLANTWILGRRLEVALKYFPKIPHRTFSMGRSGQISISDVGFARLEPDELLTFITDEERRYDLVRKNWGFYATPSLNGRLVEEGFRAVLVKNAENKYYLLLVEEGFEEEFEKYIADDQLQVIIWCDTKESIERLVKNRPVANLEPRATKRCVCTSTQFDPIFRYDSPPPGEVKFLATKELQRDNKYFREIHRCKCCGHFLSIHEMNLANLYSGDYVAANYVGSAGLKKAFDRINRLPSGQSDNLERTNWITKRYSQAEGDGVPSKLLDVGAGLGVFVYQMKKLGWDCLAIDPDQTSATHIAETAQVRSICADFRSSQEIKRLLEDEEPFNLITFNKVLEHVADPIGFLRNANEILSSDGYVYIELPDAEGACLEGQNREEFFVDHIHIFSAASLSILVEKAGFRVNKLERVKEPSSKYTLRAFCSRL